MKRWKLLLFVSALGLARRRPRNPKPNMRRSKSAEPSCAPGVYQFTVASDGYVEQLNSVAIVNDSDVLVFDTTTRPSTARTILGEIRKITSKPVRLVVNSHWHPDHWSGNEVFAAADPDLEIVATEKERDLMLNLSAFYPSYIPKGLAAQEKSVAEQFQAARGPTEAR